MSRKDAFGRLPRWPTMIFAIPTSLFIILAFLLFISSHSRSPPSIPTTASTRIRNPEHSLMDSLEYFTSTPRSSRVLDDTVTLFTQDSVRKLDVAIWKREMDDLYHDDKLQSDSSSIRIYVYEMPSRFTYDLLTLFMKTYQETSNLTSNGSPVHRLIEQHSVDYWLWVDLISPESERLLKNVVRVNKKEEADLFYIPFFSTISFFLLEKQQYKELYRDAVKWVMDQPAWKRSGGRDHILPVHHPWSLKTVRKFLKNAIWLLSDMDSTGNWYKPGQVWLEKDLILPYVPNVDLCDEKCLWDNESKRNTLLFFRGRLKRNAGGKIRAKLRDELYGTNDVVIIEGTAGEEGKTAAQNGMRKSIFCLCPEGDTPSSARLFDSIVSGCIPVIVSDELELPFEGILDYNKIALFVSSSDAVLPGWLLKFLRNIGQSQIKEMQRNLKKFSKHFVYSSPAQPLGPEDMTWKMMRGKIANIKLHTRRSQRVMKESRSLCTCECRPGNNNTLPVSLFA